MKYILILVLAVMALGCEPNRQKQQQTSDSGVKKTSVEVKTDEQGRTVEQNNIAERIKRDNDLGAVKHLYVISSYSGDVLEYSTVKGKVTSGGKRLSPRTVVGSQSWGSGSGTTYNTVIINGQEVPTNEVIDEYGAYGDSAQYFYWLDVQGNYHQYYPSGGTYVHISDRPLKPKKAVVTFEPVTN